MLTALCLILVSPKVCASAVSSVSVLASAFSSSSWQNTAIQDLSLIRLMAPFNYQTTAENPEGKRATDVRLSLNPQLQTASLINKSLKRKTKNQKQHRWKRKDTPQGEMNTLSVSTLLQKHKWLQNAPIGQRGVGGDFHHVEQFLPDRVLSCCMTLHVMKKKWFPVSQHF